MRVRIVTDSSAVLIPEWIERHTIGVVPLTIVWGGDDYRDGIDITYAEFASRASSGATPKTSSPSPGEYQAAYEQALADADELFVVTPPAELSVTYSNAALAAQASAPDRIRVFDARSAAAGQGLVVVEAARAAETASSLDAVSARTQMVVPRVRLVATLERLDYLRRSGRVPAVAAFATDALDIHPIFRFVDGTPSPVAAARGARRAAERLFTIWERSAERRQGTGEHPHVAVFHSSRADEAARLRDRVVERAPGAEAGVGQCSAALAAHLGPGMLGLAWWWEPPQ